MGGVFDPINLDGYQYAGQNPVKFVDPDGNDKITFGFELDAVAGPLGGEYSQGIAIDTNDSMKTGVFTSMSNWSDGWNSGASAFVGYFWGSDAEFNGDGYSFDISSLSPIPFLGAQISLNDKMEVKGVAITLTPELNTGTSFSSTNTKMHETPKSVAKEYSNIDNMWEKYQNGEITD